MDFEDRRPSILVTLAATLALLFISASALAQDATLPKAAAPVPAVNLGSPSPQSTPGPRRAQQPTAPRHIDPPVPGGTLTGHVTLADTHGPARFAHVLLKPVAPSQDNSAADLLKGLSSALGSSTPPDEQASAGAALNRLMSSVSELAQSTTVAMDGSYTLANVKPGDYYVHAALPGYVDPLAAVPPEDFASTDPATVARIHALAPIVTIASNGSAAQDLQLHHGASLSGRITWQDGTPAPGWIIRVIPAPSGWKEKFASTTLLDSITVDPTDAIFHATHSTNDHGEWRTYGLAPGDYFVEAVLSVGAVNGGSANPSMATAALTGTRIVLYSGNALLLRDATTISLRDGEDHASVNLQMPLTGLHSVSGRVVASSTGMTVNSGSVQLDLNGDKSYSQTAQLSSDGAFHLDYIPSGSYTVHVRSAAEVHNNGSQKLFGIEIPDNKTLHTFARARSPRHHLHLQRRQHHHHRRRSPTLCQTRPRQAPRHAAQQPRTPHARGPRPSHERPAQQPSSSGGGVSLTIGS